MSSDGVREGAAHQLGEDAIEGLVPQNGDETIGQDGAPTQERDYREINLAEATPGEGQYYPPHREKEGGTVLGR